jgi:hypothetical protein
MELPEDMLAIIKAYSQPATRPDWRTLHKMPLIIYKRDFLLSYEKRRALYWQTGINKPSIFTGHNVLFMFV